MENRIFLACWNFDVLCRQRSQHKAASPVTDYLLKLSYKNFDHLLKMFCTESHDIIRVICVILLK